MFKLQNYKRIFKMKKAWNHCCFINCDSVVKILIHFLIYVSHTLMIKFTIATSEDIPLTLVWEKITPASLVIRTSLWICELLLLESETWVSSTILQMLWVSVLFVETMVKTRFYNCFDWWEHMWHLKNQKSKDRCDHHNYERIRRKFRLSYNVGTRIQTNTPHISRGQETSVDLRALVPQNLRSDFPARFWDWNHPRP